jgi:hypothetical protein
MHVAEAQPGVLAERARTRGQAVDEAAVLAVEIVQRIVIAFAAKFCVMAGNRSVVQPQFAILRAADAALRAAQPMHYRGAVGQVGGEADGHGAILTRHAQAFSRRNRAGSRR